MATVVVSPQEKEEHDTYTLERTFRVKLLDVVTGEPVRHAYADQVKVDGAVRDYTQVLENRGSHPFRVVNAKNQTFRAKDGGDWHNFTIPLYCLKKWKKSAGSENQLQTTNEHSLEFFDDVDYADILATADGNLFHPVTAERWICTQTGSGDDATRYARRDLITNADGILEIPSSFADWLTGANYMIRFRDFMCVLAAEEFAPDVLENGHKSLDIKLSGKDGKKPIDNHWIAKAGGVEKEFVSEIEIDASIVEFGHVDAALWVVRKVKELPDGAKQTTNNRAGNNPRGIVIHYNSGRFVQEVRSGPNKWCSDALDDGEDEFMWHPEMPHRLLKALRGANTSVGYNYHVDRQGHIWLAADDALRTGHAGTSTEPNEPVQATRNGGAIVDDVATHAFTNQSSAINTRYIGVDVIGYDVETRYHFTATQEWYLDRLIENIRYRHNHDDNLVDIPWYRVLGHEEVKSTKADPGAALSGGMEGLRGRHGAFD